MKYKEKTITIKIERNIIGNIYRSYVGRKKIATSFSKQNVVDDAKKYINKKFR